MLGRPHCSGRLENARSPQETSFPTECAPKLSDVHFRSIVVRFLSGRTLDQFLVAKHPISCSQPGDERGGSKRLPRSVQLPRFSPLPRLNRQDSKERTPSAVPYLVRSPSLWAATIVGGTMSFIGAPPLALAELVEMSGSKQTAPVGLGAELTNPERPHTQPGSHRGFMRSASVWRSEYQMAWAVADAQ